ncbi:hypothetical protein [Pectobacterium brasiliense]|uniref:hypothetical protein n=1 Tax=Pectobacterium brasiliense TaxID=180957 RepID=UPI0039863A6F
MRVINERDELEKQRDALVAENATLIGFGETLVEMHNGLYASGEGFHDEGAIAYQQASLNAEISEFESIELPATESAIAEIGAMAVEQLISDRKREWLESYIDDAQQFANKLRGGGV